MSSAELEGRRDVGRAAGGQIDAGQLKVSVAKVLPLEKAGEAEELNRRHEVHGKIVLQVGS